jgi:ABC-2 type transport system permease protein
MSATRRNIVSVARREFTVRARTRSFVVATVLLAVASVALALAPVVFRLLEGAGIGRQSIGVVSIADPPLAANPVVQLGAILNLGAAEGAAGFAVEAVADEAAARAAVEGGELSAALLIDRGPDDELAFVIVSRHLPGEPVPILMEQAALSLAVSDRLHRLGVAPADQAALFAPADVTIQRPAGRENGVPVAPGDIFMGVIVGQVLVVFLFIAIILYGQWVARSTAEEKSSRVMEIVLSAATPFQLLAGKVLGVGTLGIVQLLAAVLPALLAIALQAPIAEALLGVPWAALDLGQALTPPVIAVFVLFFVLGYLLYSALFAAAGAMVSRLEDVDNISAPMSILVTVGYVAAMWVAVGMVPADAVWVTVIAYLPFTSPFTMLSLYVTGDVGLPQVALAAAILAASIPVVLWAAGRFYSAGVLMYGQTPSFRKMLVMAFGRTR